MRRLEMRYRILEETSVFADGSQRREFVLQARSENNAKR
jgi:hypothetical protein